MTKILIDEATVKLALEALENWVEYFPQNVDDIDKKVITSLREALAEQPAQQQNGPINEGWQITVAHGHSGYGVYAHMEDYPEEGAVLVQAIEQPAQQEPVALKWQQAPIRTAWGDDMVVASVAIDKDHTVCLYCERDQTPKVDAMFAQRTWVHATEWRGLTDKEYQELHLQMGPTYFYQDYGRAIEAKLRSKNEDRN